LSFGGFAIDEELFLYIKEFLPEGYTILELGSGHGTAELVKLWNVYSIEDKKKWLGKYHDQYIHAPLKWHKPIKKLPGEIWYNANTLKYALPKNYDLLLIDGPCREDASRSGFIKYKSLFNLNIPIIFDDVNRTQDWDVAVRLSGILRRPITIHNTHKTKYFGVILP